jgi:copper chaperone
MSTLTPTLQPTTLAVSGMTCHACVRHVTAALQELDGVGEVEVRLKEGRVHVLHDPASAPLTALVAALDEAGYPSAASAASSAAA